MMKRMAPYSRLPLWLVAAGLALSPALLSSVRAQEEPEARPRPAQLYEDIEVLRRILVGKLQTLYLAANRKSEAGALDLYRNLARNDPNWTNWGYPMFPGYDGKNRVWQAFYPGALPMNLEGVYLKGQGVVFTVTLPPPARNPVVSTSGASPKTSSEWDRVRREVRGEKPAASEKTSSLKGPSVAEILLRALADNGRHFTRLGADESLTVVVTFRAPSGGWAADPRFGDSPYYLYSESQLKENPTVAYNLFKKGSPSSATDYELLGDLQLRQGKLNEGLQSYGKALELKPEGKRAAAIYMKAAQGLLQQKREEQARQMIQKGLDLLKKAQDKDVQRGGTGGSPRLPAKLIVSASKRLLDRAGPSGIGFAEFRKAAHVEYLTFPAGK
jgi:tetratricopeptide (TPR) repeat protein